LKDDSDKLSTVLNDLFKGINNITILLNPFLTKGTIKAQELLSIKKDFNIKNLNKDLAGNKVLKDNLYKRI
jgi:methionyl-tRNA synthetase